MPLLSSGAAEKVLQELLQLFAGLGRFLPRRFRLCGQFDLLFAELVSLVNLHFPGWLGRLFRRLAVFCGGCQLCLFLVERLASVFAFAFVFGLRVVVLFVLIAAGDAVLLDHLLIVGLRMNFLFVASMSQGKRDLSFLRRKRQQVVLIRCHQERNVLGADFLGVFAVTAGTDSNIVGREDLNVLKERLGLTNFTHLGIHLPAGDFVHGVG